MNILILGIDGFIGWPLSLHLLTKNNNVVGVDDLSRRKIDKRLKLNSATPISGIKKRIGAAEAIFKKNIKFYQIDVSKKYKDLLKIILENDIDTIVHLAEQRSAPYSMLSADQNRYTVDRNINSTNNMLSAIVESKRNIHLVHIGTMGVYGYKDDLGKIPEGYLNVQIKSTGKDAKILFPTDPGSIYHMTKSMDQILFQFYNKNWGLKITDLHQGIVWGIETNETKLDELLINRFDYDGEYGTVLNRFIAQASIGHPLTVYGSGGQERAYIHISDSVECLTRAIENPPIENNVRIFNQISEVKSVLDIAEIISEKTNVSIQRTENPRKERDNNKLFVENEGLKCLGWNPKTISDTLLDDVILISNKYKNNIMKENIYSKARW